MNGTRLRAPDVVSLALNPSALTGAFFVLLAVTIQPAGGNRIAVAAIAVTFATIMPLAVLFLLVIRGRVSDVQMRVREERTLVYRLCIAGYAVGAVLLLAVGATWPLWGIMALHVPITATLTLLNRRWKVSIHAMVLSGMWIAAILIFGAAALPAGAFVALASWGRWAAGAHTLAELVVGATLGAALTGIGLFILVALLGAASFP